MPQPIKDAAALCKTIMRNGYDAYVINAPLQKRAMAENDLEVDICTDLDADELSRLFPNLESSGSAELTGTLRQGDAIFNFYPADVIESSYTDGTIARLTPRLVRKLESVGDLPLSWACPYIPKAHDVYDGFEKLDTGHICFEGIPDETLKKDYLRAIKALRFSANYHLPIEGNTWLAIVRACRRVLDYVSVTDFMDEWRKVEAENMHIFAQLLFDSMILHGLVPELASLSRVRQVKNAEEGEENVWDHTVQVMRRYPEELPYDWYGTMACQFHDVGKLFASEYFDGKMTFYQHHRIGSKVTRKILKRLRFNTDEVDLICHLVRHHMRFHFMLTDKGIRRFKALDEYPRLIEMARADIKARNGSYKEFNHNMKMLERAELSEEMLEPLLNGHEIMDFTDIKPGPAVGLIREALLQAQIAGDVTSVPEAIDFIMRYQEKEKIQ
ncbi:HD domain-containing protein [Desulfonatronovibrio magnus]|uniref:HD domain-containing protein n=1 Tax=Desulfonatronovibrio magnus TaxID=698827 RepID=UPI0005EB740B|nr:HD domain-containing protein [Desulfonatronovibrio magnus]